MESEFEQNTDYAQRSFEDIPISDVENNFHEPEMERKHSASISNFTSGSTRVTLNLPNSSEDPTFPYENLLEHQDSCENPSEIRTLKDFYHLKEDKITENSLMGKIYMDYAEALKNTLKKNSLPISPNFSKKTKSCKIKFQNQIQRNSKFFLKKYLIYNKDGNNKSEIDFSNPIEAESFDLYIDLLFSYPTIDQRSENFKIGCCIDGSHSSQCENLWARFKEELKRYIAAKKRDNWPKEIPP